MVLTGTYAEGPVGQAPALIVNELDLPTWVIEAWQQGTGQNGARDPWEVGIVLCATIR